MMMMIVTMRLFPGALLVLLVVLLFSAPSLAGVSPSSPPPPPSSLSSSSSSSSFSNRAQSSSLLSSFVRSIMSEEKEEDDGANGDNSPDWKMLRERAEKECLLSAPPLPRDRLLFDNCALYFVHNHKAGGTTMCNIAVQSGLSVSNPKRNCLEPDELRGSGREAQLAKFIESNNFNFIAHEFGPFLPLTNVSNRILYITVVRNPWDRVLSSMHHELCMKSLANAKEVAFHHRCSFDIEHATAADIILDPCFKRAFSSIDHYVNKFSPCPTIRGSGGVLECTPSNLNHAKRLLNLMSVIIVTDSPESYERSFPALSSIVPQMKYETRLRSGTTAHSNAKYILRHNISAWNALVSANANDYQFYRHALHLAEKQMQRIGDRASGPFEQHLFPVVDDQPYAQWNDGGKPDKFCSFN